jgi:hypothetical protein
MLFQLDPPHFDPDWIMSDDHPSAARNDVSNVQWEHDVAPLGAYSSVFVSCAQFGISSQATMTTSLSVLSISPTEHENVSVSLLNVHD